MSKQILISFASGYIMNYCESNHISFAGIKLTSRGTIGGDIRPPILGVEAFLELLKRRCDLFTQKEYADFYLDILNERHGDEWLRVLSGTQRKYRPSGMSEQEYIKKRIEAFRARANCNFYVSMIDTLHAWSMIQEAKWHDVCYIDSELDALAKTDLTLIGNGEEIKIALYGPKPGQSGGKSHYDYKVINRNNGADFSAIHQFKMPWDRPKIANKRWYKLEDFLPIKPKDLSCSNVATTTLPLLEAFAYLRAHNLTIAALSTTQSPAGPQTHASTKPRPPQPAPAPSATPSPTKPQRPQTCVICHKPKDADKLNHATCLTTPCLKVYFRQK